MEITPIVRLISTTEKPLETIFLAFRNCYSHESPEKIWDKILSNEIKPETIEQFIDEKLLIGHDSPLRLPNFVFIIDGVSRAFTAQFNRHTVGIDRLEVSQRYVDFSKGINQIVMPESFKDVPIKDETGLDNEWLEDEWECLLDSVKQFYEKATKAGVPKEDARFALPMGTVSREVVSFSFAALQHFCDLRECLRAQWEIRKVAILLHKEINKYYPLLGKKLGSKCLAHRTGYCKEEYSQYVKCRRSKIRPHKKELFDLLEQRKKEVRKI